MKVPTAHRSRAVIRLLTVGLAILTMGSCGENTDDSNGNGPTTTLKVMTRNLYLGAEFEDVISATTLAEIPGRVGAFWKSVQQSDLPGRMRLLADEIAAEAPHILAVQELELFRLQTPSNFNAAAPLVDADTVAPGGDLLALLQAELDARGLDYGPPVAINTLTDTELPAMDDDGSSFDLRLTDRDAIFVRPGILAGNIRTAAYSTFIALPVGGFSSGIIVNLLRGYTLMDVVADGTPFSFVNTHLEVGGRAAVFQEAQALELTTIVSPIKGPLVMAGDFNSAADGSTTKSYATLTRSFTDAWTKVHPSDPGPTCCSPLTSPSLSHDQRIDLVLYRGKVQAVTANRVGMDPTKRTEGALLPSDHLGMSATLNIGR